MHSEGEIKQVVRILVEKYGELTTSELKEKMSEVVDYDSDDMKLSPTRRGETKIQQIIRNIVSHQTKTFKVYDEGFALTKKPLGAGKTQAIFSAITGIGNKTTQIAPTEKKKRKAESKALEKSFQKIDWNIVNERRTELGAKGEKFVLEQEKLAARAISPALENRVIHISAEQGDGFGFDILSVDKNGDSVFIEVKTTKGGEDTPFYISKNELEFFRVKADQDNAFLYRVYEFDPEKNTGKIKKIPAKDLINDYDFEGISFCATKKKKVQK